jgi:membrane-associated protease RseP (regulator of RpoE activity)
MRRSLWTLAIAALSSFSSGCASTSLYQSWGKQLAEIALHKGRVEDVSMLLGAAPTRCEPFASPQPRIGVFFGSRKPVVTSVDPNGPAARTGLRPGDSITRINGQSVADIDEIVLAIQSNAREGQPLHIETNRGTLEIVPQLPTKAEQCYWEVQAGRVSRAGSGAYVNQRGGAASSAGSAYERFFRASCRVLDGFVVACQANWQQ